MYLWNIFQKENSYDSIVLWMKINGQDTWQLMKDDKQKKNFYFVKFDFSLIQ